MTTRIVMMSSGTGSAVAGKRVAERYGTDDLVLLFADVNGEDGDNYRFLREASEWIGSPVTVIHNDGKTIWSVFREQRFLGNTRADLCSRILKRESSLAWLIENCEPADTTLYYGFDWTEGDRIETVRKRWLPWVCDFPLCWEPMLDKGQVIKTVEAAGIEPPMLTRLGYPHANCGGGCVKAGIKQFRKLLRERPTTYAFWEWNEEQLRTELGDYSILRSRIGGQTTPLPLRALRERTEAEPEFRYEAEDWGACDCFTGSPDVGLARILREPR